MGHFVDFIRVEPTIIPSALPAATYTAGVVLDKAWKYDQLVFYISVTKASLTSVEFKIEFSMDNVTWVQESVESYSGGTATDIQLEHTILMANQSLAVQAYRYALPIGDRYVRISVKGTGTLTASAVSVEAFYGIN